MLLLNFIFCIGESSPSKTCLVSVQLFNPASSLKFATPFVVDGKSNVFQPFCVASCKIFCVKPLNFLSPSPPIKFKYCESIALS
jgi:hypothetical protein